jgi:hypothetical protein
MTVSDWFAFAGFVLGWFFLLMSLLNGNWMGVIFWGWPIFFEVPFLYNKLRPDLRADLDAATTEINAGRGSELISKLEAERARGKRSIASSLSLSRAYIQAGCGPQAEYLANEVLHMGAMRPVKGTPYTTEDLAYLVLSDAFRIQGRFTESAALKSQILTKFPQNGLHLGTLWESFLAGDWPTSRTLLQQISFEVTDQDDKLILAYMRYKMLEQDTRDEMQQYPTGLSKWEGVASHNSHNPYGARLREILDEIHMLIDT